MSPDFWWTLYGVGWVVGVVMTRRAESSWSRLRERQHFDVYVGNWLAAAFTGLFWPVLFPLWLVWRLPHRNRGDR